MGCASSRRKTQCRRTPSTRVKQPVCKHLLLVRITPLAMKQKHPARMAMASRVQLQPLVYPSTCSFCTRTAYAQRAALPARKAHTHLLPCMISSQCASWARPARAGERALALFQCDFKHAPLALASTVRLRASQGDCEAGQTRSTADAFLEMDACCAWHVKPGLSVLCARVYVSKHCILEHTTEHLIMYKSRAYNTSCPMLCTQHPT